MKDNIIRSGMKADEYVAGLEAKIRQLQGTLRYIAAQAKANRPGALAVIQANAEAALDEGAQRLARAAAST